jgi:hypothetical protein
MTRLPYSWQYLSPLDDAVRSAVQGKQSTEQALRQVAATWESLLEQHGREIQNRTHFGPLGPR